MLAYIENIFFLILVAVIGLIRWAMAATENAKNSEAQKRAAPPASNAPAPRAPAQTEEERVRRFMEALGVPATNAPPPKVPQRRITPKSSPSQKKRGYPIDPFPKPRSGPWAEKTIDVFPPPLPTSQPVMPETVLPSPAARTDAPPLFEVRVVDGRTEESRASTLPLVRPVAVAAAPESWAARLSTPAVWRDSIILREILGPPRSLQAIDLLSLG